MYIICYRGYLGCKAFIVKFNSYLRDYKILSILLLGGPFDRKCAYMKPV